MKRKLVEYRKPGMYDELHANKLTIPQRQDILKLLAAKHDYQVAYLVADKNHLFPELKNRPNLCYNYLFSLLFKRLVTAFADDICIIGDNRSVAAGSKNSLPEYIKLEAYAKWGHTHGLDISFVDSVNVKGLQAADLVASAIYAKYNLGIDHLYNLHADHYMARIQFPYTKFNT